MTLSKGNEDRYNLLKGLLKSFKKTEADQRFEITLLTDGTNEYWIKILGTRHSEIVSVGQRLDASVIPFPHSHLLKFSSPKPLQFALINLGRSINWAQAEANLSWVIQAISCLTAHNRSINARKSDNIAARNGTSCTQPPSRFGISWCNWRCWIP